MENHVCTQEKEISAIKDKSHSMELLITEVSLNLKNMNERIEKGISVSVTKLSNDFNELKPKIENTYKTIMFVESLKNTFFVLVDRKSVV